MGKTMKLFFPPFPQTLEIACGDSHIPTAATTTGMNISQNQPLKRYAFWGQGQGVAY
jgi:hypothetical protein